MTEKGLPTIYLAATTASGDPVATIRLLRAQGTDPQRETIETLRSQEHAALHHETANNPLIQADFADLK
ncbi:hypothetical protein ACFVJ5_07555 [Nocardia sp. NPDC127606]|uniref:hypothetical protein n=1 Tax=Nocardia sp. NPDC127606 TaxID=3345406 RepID=UPI0036265C35